MQDAYFKQVVSFQCLEHRYSAKETDCSGAGKSGLQSKSHEYFNSAEMLLQSFHHTQASVHEYLITVGSSE